jgi:DNA-binding transcriptional ArsR family regulator/uncharacterized protein YndB with AHSA1/START domain
LTGAVDDVFKALADPTRRRLLDSLNERDGQTLRSLCAGLKTSRQSVSKHLAILEAANLITTLRQGREKLHYLNAAPIADISDRWIRRYDRERVAALSDLKRALEDPALPSQPFVYTTYIHTTPQRLWRALTEPEFTRRYWGVVFETDWRAGSTLTYNFENRGVTVEDPEQMIVESQPYTRLAYTWFTPTPEWAAAREIGEDEQAQMAAESRSTATFTLEAVDDEVKLTVVHDGFDEGSLLMRDAAQGWPRVLSRLKTMLESGAAPGE